MSRFRATRGRPARRGDRAAVRTRLLGLVLADHPPRREPAGNPRLEVAVRDPIAAVCPPPAGRGAILSGYVVGPAGRTEHDRARDRRGRRGALSRPGRRQRRVIQGQERSFEWALAATFLTLALALIGSTALAVRFGLQPATGACRRGSPASVAARPNGSPANFRRTSPRSRPRSTSSSTPTARSSSARAPRSAISPMRSRPRSAC